MFHLNSSFLSSPAHQILHKGQKLVLLCQVLAVPEVGLANASGYPVPCGGILVRPWLVTCPPEHVALDHPGCPGCSQGAGLDALFHLQIAVERNPNFFLLSSISSFIIAVSHKLKAVLNSAASCTWPGSPRPGKGCGRPVVYLVGQGLLLVLAHEQSGGAVVEQGRDDTALPQN